MKNHGEDWRAIWQAAYDNCPYRLRWTDHMDYDLGEDILPIDDDVDKWRQYQITCVAGRYRERYGQLSAICRILGLPMLSKAGWKTHHTRYNEAKNKYETTDEIAYVSKGGQRVGHLRIEAYLQRGSRPRDPELRRKVKIMASPFGPVMAMRKLKQLGIDHLYTKP